MKWDAARSGLRVSPIEHDFLLEHFVVSQNTPSLKNGIGYACIMIE